MLAIYFDYSLFDVAEYFLSYFLFHLIIRPFGPSPGDYISGTIFLVFGNYVDVNATLIFTHFGTNSTDSSLEIYNVNTPQTRTVFQLLLSF